MRLLMALLCFFSFNIMAQENPEPEEDRTPASLRRDSITEREETFDSELSITGLVEVGFSSQTSFDKSSRSDITNDTAQLDIQKRISNLASARITLLHQDDGSPEARAIDVDEALILLGKESGPYLKAGKMILDSNFTSEFITNPVTQDLAEANEHAVAFGYRVDGLDIQVFSFNGETGKENSTDKVRSYGAHLSFERALNSTNIRLSSTYMNNAADADGLSTTDVFVDKNADGSVNDLSRLTQSLEVGLDLENEHFVAHLEWFTTLNKFDQQDLDWNGKDAHITAIKTELGWKTSFFEKKSLLAAGYQATTQALGAGLPCSRWLLGAKVHFTPEIELAYEYKYETDYSRSDSSKGVNGTSGFAQSHSLLLGLNF